MLVLTRKPGQSIMIGDGVEVQVLSVAGEKVRLGITAPRDVSIFRNEVYDRIESEATAAERRGGERHQRRRRGRAGAAQPPLLTSQPLGSALEELGQAPGGASGAVGLHVAVVDVAADLVRNRCRDQLR